MKRAGANFNDFPWRLRAADMLRSQCPLKSRLSHLGHVSFNLSQGLSIPQSNGMLLLCVSNFDTTHSF